LLQENYSCWRNEDKHKICMYLSHNRNCHVVALLEPFANDILWQNISRNPGIFQSPIVSVTSYVLK